MADTLPSSPLRLRGRPLTERIVSMFLDKVLFQRETNGFI